MFQAPSDIVEATSQLAQNKRLLYWTGMTADSIPASVPAPSRPAQEAWSEIEDLIHEIARVSRAESSRKAFYSQMLSSAVPALAATAGAVWTRRPDGTLDLECQVNFAQLELVEGSADEDAHARLLDAVLKAGHSRIVPPRTNVADDNQASNPTVWMALICPVVTEQGPVGLIEIFQRPGTSPAAQRGYLQFIGALSELAVDFHRNDELRALRDRAAQWGQFEEFTAEVHASLDLQATGFAIVNTGRRFLECDRVSVLTVSGHTWKVLAVSGLDTLDPRSKLLRLMQRMTSLAAATGQTLWYPEVPAEIPPEVETALHAYVEESHARLLAVVPLRSTGESETPAGRLAGALVVERFEGAADMAGLEYRLASLRSPCESALRSATEYGGLPLLGLSRLLLRFGKLAGGRVLPRTVLIAALCLGAILALAVIPADFTISGRGTLQPKVRRDVFAGSDGIVQEVRAEHAQRVTAGETLVVLKKSQLDFELTRVVGEIQTTQRKLAGVQASRLGTSPSNAADRDEYNKLTAEEEELKELLKSLEQQAAILNSQQQELSSRSPIDGQVLTWDVTQLLQARPVHRGQSLLTVADLEGPWVLEVQVPDHRVGHLLAAQKDQGENLAVTFILATDPDVTHHGEIEKVALSTDLDENESPSVLVTVRLDQSRIPNRRPGATVIPRLHCGRKPVGYVWFHDLWDAVRIHLLF